MRNACLTIVLLSNFALPTFAQKISVDSLRQVIAKTKDPEQYIRNRFFIGREYLKTLPDSSLAIGNEILAASKKAKFQVGEANAYELLARGYYEKAEYQKSLEAHDMHYSIRAMRQDSTEMAGIMVQKGNDFERLDQPDKALELYLQARPIYESAKDYDKVGMIYNNLGSVMRNQKKGEEALAYYFKGLSIRKKHSTEDKLYFSYSSIGQTYDVLEKYDSAVQYYQLAIAIAEKFGRKTMAAAQYNNLGVAYLNQGKNELSEQQFLKALPILVESGNKYYIGEVYRSLAKSASAMNNHKKAIKYITTALPYIEGTDMLKTRMGAHQDLVVAYKGLSDYENAFIHLEQANLYRDSMSSQADADALAELNAKFKASEKEAQIANQQLELERQASQKRTILIGAIAAVLALGGGFQYFRNKQKIKQKEVELAAQIEHAEAGKLREMDTMKSNFFANISHEFRTPLTLIVSPLEQMIHGGFKGDLQKYYRIMHRNGKRLLDLVNQLLDLSRLESGKLRLQVSEGDLGAFVRAIAYSFESLAIRKQVDYQVMVPKEPLICYFDQDKVEKILTNLISNAFKFTPDGGTVELRFAMEAGPRLEAERTSGRRQSKIEIRDTGIGIPADQLPQLFERFAKTTVSEVQPGSGIGLHLTKELVELHRGSIEVKSTEGKGTTFTVTLPVGREDFSEEQIVNAAMTTQAVSKLAEPMYPTKIEKALDRTPFSIPTSTVEKPVLLIAEDNADVRSYILDQFRGQYQILEAENGKLALEKALATTPDLIISDIMMPEMDGTEFCRLLKSNEKTSHIPVVMLTALAEQGDRLQGLETGADDYLVKPFDVRELQLRVANLIGGRQKLQEHYRKTLHTFAPTPVKAESLDAVFLNRVREAVEADLDDENFSVVELGAKVGMSRSQLHRKLTALTGFSPNEVIRNMRLERAKQLLEQEAGNASDVAYLTGFSSPAYFAKCFKDYFGMTPSEV